MNEWIIIHDAMLVILYWLEAICQWIKISEQNPNIDHLDNVYYCRSPKIRYDTAWYWGYMNIKTKYYKL